MSEKDFGHEFVHICKQAGLDPWRIENVVGVGTPDVNISTGWVELKWVRQWPAWGNTIVKLPHYTDIQRERLLTRWLAGGGAWLALRCRQEWLIYEAPNAQHVGHQERAGLVQLATHYFPKKPSPQQLKAALTRPAVA